MASTSSIPPSSPDGRARTGFPWWVLIAGVGLSLLVGGWQWRQHRAGERAELERRSRDLEITVQRVLDAREQVLRGMRVLIDHSELLTEAEFQEASRDYIARFPDIAALEWVPRVPAAEREAYEVRLARRSGGHGIMEQTSLADLTLRPAGERAAYFPVTFIEPLEPNRPALGFDIGQAASWPSRQWSMRTGQPGGSGIVDLYRQPAEGPIPGWIMHLPVYTSTALAESGTTDPEALRGFLLGVFRIDDLMAVVRGSQAAAQLDLWLGEANESAPTKLYQSAAGDTVTIPGDLPRFEANDRWSTVREVRSGDRTWGLGLRATSAWQRQSITVVPLVLLGLGLAVSGLGASLLAAVRRRHEAVRHEVALRTEELRASREELAGILENSPNMIFVKDLEGRYLSANHRFCTLLGRPREEILRRTDAELFPAEEAELYQQIDEEVIREGKPVTREDTSLAGPHTVHSIVHKFPLYDEQGRIRAVCGIATDVTELKRLEADRRAVERKMLEAQRLESLGVLAGGVAHDFNNLLTGVLGNASLALMELEPDSSLRPLVEDMSSAGKRAAELCTQLLDYSGKSRREPVPVDLNALIEELLPLLRHTVAKSTRLQLELMPALPATLADTSQLRQVIMNLVINGSEALGGQSGTVTVATSGLAGPLPWAAEALVNTPQSRPPWVLLRVSDTGHGMDEATRARVLDPFFTTKFTGRGLGLAAVGGIVRGHHGALRLDSEPGRGTTFELALPASPATALAPASNQDPSDWRGEGRVLVIDDEEALRRVAERALQHLGFTVDTAPDGQSGWEMIAAQPDHYTAVLLDLTMPGWSGREVWNLLQELRPELPVVLMSGYSRLLEAGKWAGEAPAGLLAKPFTIGEMRKVFRAALKQ